MPSVPVSGSAPGSASGPAPVPGGRAAEGMGRPYRPEPSVGPRSANEIVIGMALTATWMLATGRRLDQPPLLHDLTADQLIDFWADDHTADAAGVPRQECPSPGPRKGIVGIIFYIANNSGVTR